MAAVGWYVGLVHYPTFLRIEHDRWAEFHQHHTQMTGIVVVGPMALQILSALALLVTPGISVLILIAQLVLLALSAGWTFAVSGPLHLRLPEKDEAVIQRLIATNHPRAIAWTLQAALSIFMLLNLGLGATQ